MMTQQGEEINHNDPAFMLESIPVVVWPWMVVLANMPVVQYKDRGVVGKKLKDDWVKQGYNPIKVHLLWSHLGFAVVEFGIEWDGFNNAKMFVKDCEVNKHGRKEWYDGTRGKDDKIYAWIANDEDYYSTGVVGDFLRKNVVLKTLSAIEKENEVKYPKLNLGLEPLLEEMSNRSKEIQSMTNAYMASVMKQIENFNEDVTKMQEKTNKMTEHVQIKTQHEDHEKKMNVLAMFEQKKEYIRLLKLSYDDKRDKQNLEKKIVENEREIDQMKEDMDMMTDEIVEAKKRIESIQKDVEEKEKEIKELKELKQVLIVKEQWNNERLIDTREDLISENNKEELVVWPLMVVVANIPFEHKDDSYLDDGFLGDIAKNLKDEWIKEGYKPLKVYPLWSCLGHSGFAVVEFGEEWDGFNNAKMFVKDFEVERHGRKDWYDSNSFKDDKLYSWIANDEDYYSSDLVGDYLKEHADLKTVSDFFKEADVKISELYLGLKTNFEETMKRNEEFHKAMMIEDFDFMTAGFDMTIENYKTEHAMMQEKVNEQLKKISTETKLQLEEHDKEMRAHEAVNETAQKKLHNEKKMNKLAVLEQKKVDDRMSKLADEQKREKEKFHQMIMEFQKKLDVRQRLELGINQMKGTLEVMKHITDEDVDAKELRAHEALNESDQMKKELTVLEQKEADDRMLKVDDDQKVLKE